MTQIVGLVWYCQFLGIHFKQGSFITSLPQSTKYGFAGKVSLKYKLHKNQEIVFMKCYFLNYSVKEKENGLLVM